MVEMGNGVRAKSRSHSLTRLVSLRAAPDTNLHGEGKMPSGQPAGPFDSAQGRLPALRSELRLV